MVRVTDYHIHHGACLETLQAMPNNFYDSVVTDPPYGLSKEPDMAEVLRHWLNGDDYHATGGGFMGKSWDSFVPGPATWREVLRVMKPGAYAVVFAGARTQDLMTIALRLAGFEIRDSIRYWYDDDPRAAAQDGGGLAWVYGSGFPKSLDIGKAIDEWSGWGTALKPGYEPIIIARKPLAGTVADNVLTWGTGAINIDGCRVPIADDAYVKNCSGDRGHADNRSRDLGFAMGCGKSSDTGRWPANVMHDGSEEVLAAFPDATKSAARFFYCPKATKRDRNEGLGHLPHVGAGEVTGGRAEGSAGLDSPRAGAGRTSGARNTHPTVKPTELIRYLCRLVTRPSGTVLDPFAGSGSTGKAALLEGFTPILIEREAEYLPIIDARCAWAMWQRLEEQSNEHY